ncbi:GNAT family protein [Streptomyces sp. NPDC048357]|uniref:GNAT family N-acetyltransferase n=1 Tax=Streptomyces sp. NPDC048357 TaxID=3154719 RepID=UPI00341A501B
MERAAAERDGGAAAGGAAGEAESGGAADGLTGERVRLEPLAHRHHDGLCEAVREGRLWDLPVTMVPHPDEVRGFIDEALAERARGTQIAYATVDLATGRIAGSTRLMAINTAFRRLEIGFTFLGASWQGTGANTEAKLLMLTHAFEAMGMNRVEFLTDVRNGRSRAAISGLGATLEGVLRHHMVMRDGWIRDSAVYSITRPEWPDAKKDVTARLARRG